MLIAEQLLLLALDPLSGDWLDRAAADPAVLTAALLLELATLGDLRLQAGQLQLQPGPPNYHLLIQDVRARLQQTTPATAAQLLANRHITPSGLAGQLLRGELVDAVRSLLAEMDADHVALLTAKYLDEMSVAEMVDAMGGTSESVRSKLARARRDFRQRFERWESKQDIQTGAP